MLKKVVYSVVALVLYTLNISAASFPPCNPKMGGQVAANIYSAKANNMSFTTDDRRTINAIFSSRLKGIMVKIIPNFSANGLQLFNALNDQIECLGGIDAAEGRAFISRFLQLFPAS